MDRYNAHAEYHGEQARDIYISPLAAVGIPTAQALITGLIMGFLGGSIAWAAGADQPLQVGAIFFAGSSLLAWLATLNWWRTMVVNVEYTLGMGLYNLADWEPEAEAEAEPAGQAMTRVEIKQDNQLAYPYFPASSEQLLHVAQLIHSGATLSLANLTPIFLGSRPGAQRFQSYLIEKSFAVWRNPATPTQGIRLTKKGRAVFDHLGNFVTSSPTSDVPYPN